jgi:hypothetical protein
MTISTIVTWDPLLVETSVDEINAKATAMAAEGKTDNIATHNEPPHPPMITVRTWTTMADAEEWIAFVESYSPASATIQQT